MNILFVSAVFPYPLYSGGQIRIYNLLKRLSRNHTISLYSFIRDKKENIYKKELSFCKEIKTIYRGRAWQPSYIIRTIFGKYPFVMTTYDNGHMRDEILNKIKTDAIDILHIEPGYVYPSLPEVSIPYIVGEHNIEHQIYEDYAEKFPFPVVKQCMQKDVAKLKQWEEIIWKKAHRIIAVSDEDAAYISKKTKTPISIVPNGVDEDMFEYKPKDISEETITFLFVGNFRWVQNQDAVKYLLTIIWPTITVRFPTATLRIVGREFPKKLEKYTTPSVHIVDHVEEITDEFYRSDILLAPIRIGGGTKYKILESMACGVPVITTKKGTEGLPLEDEKHCYIALNDNDWVEKVSKIVTQQSMNKKIVQNARKLIESKYTWKHISQELDNAWINAYEKKKY